MVPVGRKLAAILNAVVSKNDQSSLGSRLLGFGVCCLRTPMRGGHHCSLASTANRQLYEKANPPDRQQQVRKHHCTGQSWDPVEDLASSVCSKLEEEDFKGAVRLTCSDDALADRNDATLAALRRKHRAPTTS